VNCRTVLRAVFSSLALFLQSPLSRRSGFYFRWLDCRQHFSKRGFS